MGDKDKIILGVMPSIFGFVHPRYIFIIIYTRAFFALLLDKMAEYLANERTK